MAESTTIEVMPHIEPPQSGMGDELRRVAIGIVPTVLIALLTAWGMYSYDKGQREEMLREFRSDIQEIKATVKETCTSLTNVSTKIANIEGRLAATKSIP